MNSWSKVKDELKTFYDTDYGKLSGAAIGSIHNNTIDSYVPLTEEKGAWEKFKKTYTEKVKEYEEKQLADYKSNPTFIKYGIDPLAFDQKAFEKWADEHNFVYSSQADMYVPKREGDFLNIWGTGGHNLATDEDSAELLKLQTLAKQNERRNKAGAFETGFLSFTDSVTLGLMPKMINWAEGDMATQAGLNDYVMPERFIPFSNYYNKAKQDNPIASGAGSIAGMLVPLSGVGGAVAKGTKAIPWLAKAPTWIQGAVNSGITFGVISGAETTIAGGTPEEILQNTGISTLGGAVGGSLSSIVGGLGEKILFDKGLQNKIIPEMIRNGVASSAFAGGKTLSTYALYPEGSKPSTEQIAQDLAIAFAFGAISTAKDAMKMSAANKAYLENLTNKMQSDYETIVRANVSGKEDTAGIHRAAEGIIKYSDLANEFIAKNRFVGQDKYVNIITDRIGEIRSNANAVLNGMGTPSTGMTTTNPTSTAIAPVLPVTPNTSGSADVVMPPVVNTPAVNTPVESAPGIKPGDVLSPKSNNNTITVIETDGKNAKIEVDNGTATTEKVVPVAAINRDIAAGNVEKQSVTPSQSETPKQNTFKRSTFSVRMRDGLQEINGEVYNGVGVSKQQNGGYSVTHVGSGLKVLETTSLKDAKAKAKYLADTVDMTQSADNNVPFLQSVGEIVKSLNDNPQLYKPQTTDTPTVSIEQAKETFANDLYKNSIVRPKGMSDEQYAAALESRGALMREQANKRADEVAAKFTNLDFDALTSQMHNGNKMSLRFLKGVTGMPVNNQANIKAAIRSLAPAEYDAWETANVSAADEKVLQAQREQSAQKQAEAEKLHSDYSGFLDNIAPLRAGQIKKALDKGYSTSDFGSGTYKSFIESAIKSGWNVRVVPSSSGASKYFIASPESDFRQGYTIPKTAFEYALHLRDNGVVESPAKNNTAPEPAPQAEQAQSVSKSETIITLSEQIKNKLSNGEKLTFAQVQEMANTTFGGTLANNDYDIQDVYEAMELAFNEWVIETKPDSVSVVAKTLDLLPTQTKRSEKKERYQMFSTPPTLSYLANASAHTNDGDIVLEPSAGTGSLASFAIADGADVIVNELDTQRLELLKSLPVKMTFNEDAAHIGNIIADTVKPSLVIMNPPFSNSATTGIKNTGLTISHIKSAFSLLPVGGRLVTITGESYAPTENAFRNMVKSLNNADFRANLSFDGNVYTKYGTSFGTQLIVIDKLPKNLQSTVAKMAKGVYNRDNLQNAEALLDKISREKITDNIFVNEFVKEGVTDNGRTTEQGGISSNVSPERTTDVGERNIPDNSAGVRENTRRGRNASEVGVRSDGSDGFSGSARQSDSPTGNLAGTGDNDGDRSAVSDRRSEKSEPAPVTENTKREIARDTDAFSHYPAPEFDFDMGSVKLHEHPTPIVESNALAFTTAPKITYKPNLPKTLIEDGGVSDIQLEAIARAGQAHALKLPNGERKGFFIGDGTGVGKGREIAGVVLDNFRQGRDRAIWLSENKGLFNDAQRDISAVFKGKATDDTINLFEGGKKANTSLDKGNITYMTYSTLQSSYQEPDSNLNKLITNLGKDFDGVIVFDEAHNISNVGGEDSGRGKSKSSKSAEAAQELLKQLPNARVLYVSATGIPKAERLPYLSRLGLWGEGMEFPTSEALISTITQNPSVELALMESLAQTLKRQGLYVSRSLSYSGIEYKGLKTPLTKTQIYEFDKFAEVWRHAFKQIFDSAAEAAGGKTTDNPLITKLNKGFYGAVQRFFMSLNTTMKMDDIIKDAKEQIKDGKQVVIQFFNTNESSLNRAIQENTLVGNEDYGEIRPLQILEELIANVYPINILEEYLDDNGNKKWRIAEDSNGNPIVDRAKVAQRGELLQEIKDLEDLPDYRISAMDKLINAFGKDNVAEITGRKNFVLVDENGKAKIAKRNSLTANTKEAKEFNEGKRDVLFFSLPSGGTGFSFQDLNDRQRVFYYAETGWAAVGAAQGEGRVNRSGQKSKPIYVMPSNGMPIEKRTMSAITNRMAELGALTKGQRDTTANSNFDVETSTNNMYGKTGLQQLYTELLRSADGKKLLSDMALLHRITDEDGRLKQSVDLDEKYLFNVASLLGYQRSVDVSQRYFAIVEELVSKAKEQGTYQEKLKKLPAEKITVENEADNGKGLTLREIDVVRKSQKTPYNANLKTYKKKSDGEIFQARSTSTYIDSNGDNVQNYKLIQPNGSFEYINEKSLDNRFEPVKDAKSVWETELSEIPATYNVKAVTLSGEILGNFKYIPRDFKVNIIQAEGKSPYIGVVITDEADMRNAKRNFEIAEETKAISPKDIITQAMAGNTVKLKDFSIKKSKVSGETRLELLGVHPAYGDSLNKLGVFTEIIDYRTRKFIPINKAEEVISAIQDSTRFSLGKNTKEQWTANPNDKNILGGEYTENKTGVAAFTDEKLDTLFDYYSVKPTSTHKDYAQRYITYISPTDFLDLTTYRANEIAKSARDQFGQLDISILADDPTAPFLMIDMETGEVTGHEGRHRISLLKDAGIEKVAIQIVPDAMEKGKYERKLISSLHVTGQKFSGGKAPGETTLKNITPLSNRYRDEVYKRFGSAVENAKIKYSNAEPSAERWGTDNTAEGVEIKPIHDIIQYISEAFNLPISTGNIKRAKAKGAYNPTPQTIRERIANDLPTVSHELGHYFDDKYGLTQFDTIDYAIQATDEDFLESYSDVEKPGEAVAEFVRTYLQSKDLAEHKYTHFYREFVDRLSGEDLKKLDTAAEYINNYMSAGFSDRVESAIVSGKDDRKPTFDERRKQAYMKIVDSFAPIKDAVGYVEKVKGGNLSGDGDAYILATNSRNAAAVTEQIIKRGLVDLNGEVVGKSLIDCIKDVAPTNLNTLDKYLVLRHSLEWLDPQPGEDGTTPKVKRVFADETLQDIDLIKKEMVSIEGKFPEIKQAAENLYEYQRKMMEIYYVGGGGMTEGFMNYLNARYPDYVPFYRAVNSTPGNGRAKATFANQRVPVRRAKGSGASIISPLESIVKNTDKAVKFALRNRTMQIITSYADDIKGFGQFMEKIPADKIPYSVNVKAYKKQIEKSLEGKLELDDFATVTNLLDDVLGDRVTGWSPVVKAGKQVVTVLRQGEPEYYQVHDSQLYTAIAEISPMQLPGILKLSSRLMNPVKMLITQNNPLFSGSNAMRDYQTAYKNSIINNPIEFAKRYAQAFKEVVTDSDDFRLYKALGGGHSSELSATRDLLKKDLRELAKSDMGKARRFASSLLHPVDLVAEINDFIESTPRFLEFKAVKEKTDDRQKAIYAADDVTVNFKRTGSTGRAINAAIMFNNAQVQGLDKLYRSFKDATPDERKNRILKYVITAILMAALLAWWNRENDEEGYNNLSTYMKNSQYPISIGNGRFIRIPKAREMSLLDSFVDRVIDYSFGDKEAFYNFGEYVAGEVIPPVLPSDFGDVPGMIHSVAGSTILGPFVDIGFNKDFKGSPIVSEANKRLPKQQQYNEKTTIPAKILGQLMNQSPMEIDHVLSSYGGILGTLNKAMLPTDGEQRDWTFGAKTRFVADSNYSTDVLNRVYEMRDKTSENYTITPTSENAMLNEKWSLAADYISNVNKAIKDMPESQKRDARAALLRSVNRWNVGISDLDRKIMTSTDGGNPYLTSLPPIKLEITRNKVKYTYTMSPAEYKEYVDDVLKELNIQREKALKVNESYRSGALEKAKTNAKSTVKEKYLRKFADKLKKE